MWANLVKKLCQQPLIKSLVFEGAQAITCVVQMVWAEARFATLCPELFLLGYFFLRGRICILGTFIHHPKVYNFYRIGLRPGAYLLKCEKMQTLLGNEIILFSNALPGK